MPTAALPSSRALEPETGSSGIVSHGDQAKLRGCE